jgi:hypothetical protein
MIGRMEELRNQTSNEFTKKRRKKISEEGKKEGIIHSCVDERKIVGETKH